MSPAQMDLWLTWTCNILYLMNPCTLEPLDPLFKWVRGPALNFLIFQLCVGPNINELTRYTALLFERHQSTSH